MKRINAEKIEIAPITYNEVQADGCKEGYILVLETQKTKTSITITVNQFKDMITQLQMNTKEEKQTDNQYYI